MKSVHDDDDDDGNHDKAYSVRYIIVTIIKLTQ